MSAYRPPEGQPKTEKHLGQLVSQYAEASGLGVRRVRQRVSAMAFVGSWPEVYAGLAAETEFPIADVAEAAAGVQLLIDRIEAA